MHCDAAGASDMPAHAPPCRPDGAARDVLGANHCHIPAVRDHWPAAVAAAQIHAPCMHALWASPMHQHLPMLPCRLLEGGAAAGMAPELVAKVGSLVQQVGAGSEGLLLLFYL